MLGSCSWAYYTITLESRPVGTTFTSPIGTWQPLLSRCFCLLYWLFWRGPLEICRVSLTKPKQLRKGLLAEHICLESVSAIAVVSTAEQAISPDIRFVTISFAFLSLSRSALVSK